MINSESLLHSKDNLAVERFRNAITDLLLEASAAKGIPNYSINKSVVLKFNQLVSQAQKVSGDIFSEYSTPYKLLSETKILGQSLATADLDDLLANDSKRDATIAGLENFYNSLMQLILASSSGRSSLFLVG